MDIESLFTGTATIIVKFRESVRKIEIAVVEGQKITVPTGLFNESHTHEMEVWNDDVLAACYKVNTSISRDVEDAPIPPLPEEGIGGQEYTGNGANSQQFNGLSGNVLLLVNMNGQSYTSDFWIQVGSTVTWKDMNVLFDGVIVLTWH